jgi:hypothetical protein
MVHGFWDEERVALANRELAGNGTAIRGQVDGPESYRQRWVHYRD